MASFIKVLTINYNLKVINFNTKKSLTAYCVYCIITADKEVVCTNILISALSQTPIYEQIQNQIKEMVLSGNIKSKDQLPSIRLMAKDLKVGIITVKRAYEELEKEGIVINLQGRGCFVAEINLKKVKGIHIDMLRERLLEIKDFADTSGLSHEEIIEVVNEIYGGYKYDK
ncbi:GntR family transcriptional regulator [Clostridium estertheticum]|uniref:GntR family transcriptional regulator n=1 Tax=Clostridium estertheticum TaxID=238834 RepID=UPI0027149744|nr:GntR family transcriptional regulator [Clostridium estertheticum]WLC79649.1 GntR family transcriptional regulator [Clostridium estertheticum]WLC86754.1 GntR family transcriptional regulator [Clostridium estertheticum]